MGEFINFYLKSEEDKLKKKWKLIDYIINENIETINSSEVNSPSKEQNYFSISRLKEILKQNKEP